MTRAMKSKGREKTNEEKDRSDNIIEAVNNEKRFVKLMPSRVRGSLHGVETFVRNIFPSNDLYNLDRSIYRNSQIG